MCIRDRASTTVHGEACRTRRRCPRVACDLHWALMARNLDVPGIPRRRRACTYNPAKALAARRRTRSSAPARR
eukprot:1017618-Alexandrium_andersonii.AAC.1